MAVRNLMRPIHPGEILRDQYLVPLGLSANKLAAHLGVPANRITAILNETRGVTAETALRLGRFFDTTPDFWLNMQKSYDLRKAEIEFGDEIERTVKPKPEGLPALRGEGPTAERGPATGLSSRRRERQEPARRAWAGDRTLALVAACAARPYAGAPARPLTRRGRARRR